MVWELRWLLALSTRLDLGAVVFDSGEMKSQGRFAFTGRIGGEHEICLETNTSNSKDKKKMVCCTTRNRLDNLAR